MTIAMRAAQYAANAMSAVALGGCPAATRKMAITAQNTASVITALEIEVTTRIQDGNRAFVNRKPLACSDVNPLFVPSAKKSHRNRPTMRSSLEDGRDANRIEKTAISTMNIVSGLSSAQRKPPNVPSYRGMNSVRVTLQVNPAR